MKCAVVVFSETNCDVDVYRACEHMGWNPEYVSDEVSDLSAFDIVILPGSFSGYDNQDYKRLVKFRPIIKAIADFIQENRGFVVGICSGFQLLCEMELLPGSLIKNDCNKFICDDIEFIFSEYNVNRTIVLPISHLEGKYYADPQSLTEVENKNMVFIKYKLNPNGSVSNIAGLYNREKHVLGLIPRPEKAVFKELGTTDGKRIFDFIKCELDDMRVDCI